MPTPLFFFFSLPSPIWPLIQPFAFIPNWMTGRDQCSHSHCVKKLKFLFLFLFLNFCIFRARAQPTSFVWSFGWSREIIEPSIVKHSRFN